jgi:hypothetical protein
VRVEPAAVLRSTQHLLFHDFIISIVPGTSVLLVFDSIDPTFPCGARVHC